MRITEVKIWVAHFPVARIAPSNGKVYLFSSGLIHFQSISEALEQRMGDLKFLSGLKCTDVFVV